MFLFTVVSKIQLKNPSHQLDSRKHKTNEHCWNHCSRSSLEGHPLEWDLCYPADGACIDRAVQSALCHHLPPAFWKSNIHFIILHSFNNEFQCISNVLTYLDDLDCSVFGGIFVGPLHSEISLRTLAKKNIDDEMITKYCWVENEHLICQIKITYRKYSNTRLHHTHFLWIHPYSKVIFILCSFNISRTSWI